MARAGAKRKSGDRYPGGRLKAAKAPVFSTERAQHDPIIREAAARQRTARDGRVAQLVDANGEISDPFIVVDLIRRLEAAGRITSEAVVAADQFRWDFRSAFGHRFAASDPSRPVVSGKRTAEMSDASVSSRRRIERVIAQLGAGSPAASCAWHVIGLESSLLEWARRRRWSGRHITGAGATLILIATIEALIPRHRSAAPAPDWREAAE